MPSAASLLLAGAFLALAGCTAGPAAKTNAYLVSAKTTEFFKYGPAQAFGADQALPKGERVTMVQRSFGYSQIKLADDTLGYVATEDLKPAPPPPTPPRSRAAPKARSGGGGIFRRSHVEPVPNDPLFDVTDIPLPLPTDPEKPKP